MSLTSSFRSTFSRMLLVLVIITASAWLYWQLTAKQRETNHVLIALLTPDNISVTNPMVSIWINAAKEDGIWLKAISASSFLRPDLFIQDSDYAGVIIPDSILQSVGPMLLAGLKKYIQRGGKLMLVFDAATLTLSGNYYPLKAPLSKLAGIDYALYDSLQDKTTESGAVIGSRVTLAKLGIPPGKSLPFTTTNPKLAPLEPYAIAGYQYGYLRYSSFITHGDFTGEPLLYTASGGIAAGYHPVGPGGVLFVNIPLGFLGGHTDALLLHSFLDYFARNLLELPTLSAAPDGIGGLIFNWHVDSSAAMASLAQLDAMGLMKQGPYSIHFTAGPDLNRVGDGLGLDIAHNAKIQLLIKRFQSRGDAIGSHGGWMHNYFGRTVSNSNQATMAKYLTMNDQAIQAITGVPVREYSAPLGKQPEWVTAWLEAHGFVAYYFDGNTSTAPTRSYRNGQLFTPKIWSFPIITFGTASSFEEFSDKNMANQMVLNWLDQISDYTADNGTIRTFYSHPPEFLLYRQVIFKWLQHTQQLLNQKRFKWYTMTRVADFLTRRELTVWHILSRDNEQIIEASNPVSLEHLSWELPVARYSRPKIEKGTAVIMKQHNFWQVTADKETTLRFSSHILKKVN